MEIVDELEQKQTGKKIELVCCLQVNYDENDDTPYFSKSKYPINPNVFKIRRIAKSPCEKYDLILVTYGNESTNIFLGHWNDGIVN